MKLALMLVILVAGAGPATRPADSAAELREQIRTLRQEVERLKVENAELRRELAKSDKPSPQDAAVTIAIREHRLAVGMTLAEANRAMTTEGKLTGEDGMGKVYRWYVFPMTNTPQRGHPVDATFVSGHLKEWTDEGP